MVSLASRGHRLLHQPVSPQLDPRYACLDGWTASSCVGTSRRICKTLCRLKHTVSSDEAESGTASSSLVSSGETSILGFGSSRLTQLVEWQRTFEAERDPLCPSSRKRIEKKGGGPTPSPSFWQAALKIRSAGGATTDQCGSWDPLGTSFGPAWFLAEEKARIVPHQPSMAIGVG